ncbi:holo-ACP synthase [Parendozoicomonas haliclonae]|uniref:Holo-[acyl-carrier-protein] synthase n=1 Tax=Parendozoicomonas haliclonae TaxID=1960125 RepID=A0A1X7AQU0_9GAMM|nr:holo-ACP synthase [Parendozoicomonas haliclonae]SMA50459.1 Holo-[acyl-carrier-protein] synthase [Parendozoicomonas haliclonae]
MIVGIGTDIASIPRIEAAWKRTGDRFARRILTDAEYAVFEQRSFSPAYLATRFAAKEAASKAFGTGIGKVSFQEMEITNLESGAPVMTFSGAAEVLQMEKGIQHIHISLSDEKEFAQAFVIFES